MVNKKGPPVLESPHLTNELNAYENRKSSEPHAGIEPATYALQVRRSAN